MSKWYKIALLGVAALFAAGIAASAGTTPKAKASVTTACADGYYYDGYEKAGLPTNSNGIKATIQEVSSTVHDGHVSGWIGVSNNAATKWIQTGIWQEGNDPTPIEYIEYNSGDGTGNHFPLYTPIAYGVTRDVRVFEFLPGEWRAVIQTDTFPYTAVYTLNFTPQRSDFQDETYNIGGVCNAENFRFTNISPWATGTLIQGQDAPYFIHGNTTTTFNSSGP